MIPLRSQSWTPPSAPLPRAAHWTLTPPVSEVVTPSAGLYARKSTQKERFPPPPVLLSLKCIALPEALPVTFVGPTTVLKTPLISGVALFVTWLAIELEAHGSLSSFRRAR